MNLENMNEAQKKAILKTEGPLLVLAGAGSGKTRVLTTKVAYLIKEKKVNPRNILAITFTNKASNEMKERIETLVGPEAMGTWVSTFHSFGLNIIKENYKELGMDKNFTILDSNDSLTVIKRVLKELNLDSTKFNAKSIKNKISSSKNEMITPKGYIKYALSEYEKQIHLIYQKYEEKLRRNNSVDFDDLLLLPLKLFKENKKVLEEYQERFKYVLVDEYQDTNTVQYLLTKSISDKYKNICVVGDDSQSIYSWRGANFNNILNFEKDYKNAEVVLLEQNYRSTKNILSAANKLIANNINRKDKNLWTEIEDGFKLSYKKCYDEKDEAHYVAKEIEKLIVDGINPDDIAVLYRTNAQSRVMEEEMLVNSIPYKVIGSFYFYNRAEIKDLISYLKLLYNQKDDISLLRCINVPKRGIGKKTIENLQIKANTEAKSLYDAIDSGKELEFKKIMEKLIEKSKHLSLTELIDLVLEETSMKKALEDEKTLESEIRLENLNEFKSITKGYEERYGEVSLSDFLEELMLVADSSEYKESSNNVNLMTVHSVKGLEFDYVFIIGLEEGIFPHANSFNESASLEEERRLMYVAITRAKKVLYLTNAKRRMLYGREQNNLASRFIKEIGQEFIDSKDSDFKEFKTIDKTKMFNDEEVDYKVGDHVVHDTYKSGVIVSVDNKIITVAFSHQYGVKQLMKNHKSIRKE